MLTIPSLSSGQHKNVAFTSLKNAFAMCVSDAALTFFDNSNEIAAALEEAKETAKNYTFSSMVCMFALSTVIQCAIQSYYPLTNDTVAKENWDSLDSIVQYIHGIILMAVQLNMSISFVVLRCHRLIWLIIEFHPPKIILLPCANQLKRFSQETIVF